MKSDTFELIRSNQISVACIVATILSWPTLLVTLRIQMASSTFDEDIHKAYFFKGVDSPTEDFQPCHDCIRLTTVQNIVTWTTRLSFTASALHFLSSIWTLFKKSPTSISLWIGAQFLALVLLVISVLLPTLNHLSSSYMLLSMFYAVLVVDGMLTLVLIAVVSYEHWLTATPVPKTLGPTLESMELGSVMSGREGNSTKANSILTDMRDNVLEEALPPAPPVPSERLLVPTAYTE